MNDNKPTPTEPKQNSLWRTVGIGLLVLVLVPIVLIGLLLGACLCKMAG